jgi:hypothetical protein
LTEEESQMTFYERRIANMPLRVLRGHKVARREGNPLSLEVPKLSYQQAAAVRALCEADR